MVTVVGAGPAGATAARALALAGMRVRLLDRSSFPRNKPCGGGISIRALGRFPYLQRELARIPTHPVSRLHLEAPDGEAVDITSDEPAALMVRRVDFDDLLVRLAVEAGAELITGADVVQAREHPGGITVFTRSGRRFEAPALIAADGVHSVVGRRLGIRAAWPRSAVALDMMEETPRATLRDTDPSTLWVVYGYNPFSGARIASGEDVPAYEGYAYVFPKRDHVNVGVGYLLAQYMESIDEPPYELQRRFVEHLRERGVVEGQSARRYFTPFLLPVGGPLRRPGRGRVLLAGDAAGFVNGFTAEGIYYAMVSGELAARAVAEGLRRGSAAFVAPYRRACRSEMGAELRDSVVVQRFLFRDPRRIAAMVRGARQEPALTRLFLDVVSGRAAYGTFRRRLIARAPGVALRLALQLARRH